LTLHLDNKLNCTSLPLTSLVVAFSTAPAHFIEQANSSWEQNQGLTLGLWHQASLVGVISFHKFDWPNQASSIGYWLAETYQGKGIMTSACKALVGLGFSKLGLQSITIRCAVGNLPSQKIAQRLGFSFTATKKDAEWLYDHYAHQQVYTMYAHDWLEQCPNNTLEHTERG